MSRGGCAAMFYSPPVDSLDIRTPSLRLSSSLTEFLLLLLEITLTDSSKTYRLQKYSPSPLLIRDRPKNLRKYLARTEDSKVSTILLPISSFFSRYFNLF